jgi:hypothetical protein
MREISKTLHEGSDDLRRLNHEIVTNIARPSDFSSTPEDFKPESTSHFPAAV